MLRNLAFTVCSINYLAQAKTLGISLRRTNPDFDFRIYLVDKLTGIKDVKVTLTFTIIEIEELDIPQFEGMAKRYNLVELNTSVKPFIIDTIFREEDDVQNIIYLDPDIKVFHSLSALTDKLVTFTAVLTPHSTSPSDNHPYGQPEVNYLSTGIFNLGFIAFSRSTETFKILEWWKEKLVDQGYKDHQRHLFYDQKWMNLAPVFFNDICIEKNIGYNVAGWNLHERKISQIENTYYVNEVPLIFYHFSGLEIIGDNISIYSKYQLNDRPDLADILSSYRKEVLANNYVFLQSIKCSYSPVNGNSDPKTTLPTMRKLRFYLKRAIRSFTTY